MTECDYSQSSGSTVPVAVEQRKSPDLHIVITKENAAGPSCTPECGSMAELINETVERICLIDREDSRGPGDVTNKESVVSLSHRPSSEGGKTGDSFLGMDGQVWQKRGRFTIWPVSIGEERHV